jgi:putative superfamily III holin-X
MSETFKKVEELTDHVKDYITTKVEITKLRFAEKTSLTIGNIIAAVVVAVLFLFVILFGSIAGAWALSDWIGKNYAGFLIVTGFYLVVAIIVWFARNRLIRFPVMNAIIKMLHKKDDDENDNNEVGDDGEEKN